MKLKSNLPIVFLFLIIILIFGVYATVYTTETPNPGHTADNILVKTATGEPTLQQAIDSGSLCNSNPLVLSNEAIITTVGSIAIGPLNDYSVCFLTRVVPSGKGTLNRCTVGRGSTDWILISESGSLECGARCIR